MKTASVYELRLVSTFSVWAGIEKAFYTHKKMMHYDPIGSRAGIDCLMHDYLFKQDVVTMFVQSGMASVYMQLIKQMNKVLDGDLL